jgi:hypothetical protein
MTHLSDVAYIGDLGVRFGFLLQLALVPALPSIKVEPVLGSAY